MNNTPTNKEDNKDGDEYGQTGKMNLKEIHEWIEKLIAPRLDEAFNMGVGGCVKVLELERDKWNLSFDANPNKKFFQQFYQDIISKLNSLKK